MSTFFVELGENPDFDSLQRVMDAYHDALNLEIVELAKELGVSDECAMDVMYLRSRSRHTPELESQLIELHKNGTRPNMCDFGCES